MSQEFYKCIEEWADRCREKDKAIDALQAKVRELEEALRAVSSVGRNILKPKFDHCGFMNATQLGNRDAVLHMLKQVECTLKGKEEHGTRSERGTDLP